MDEKVIEDVVEAVSRIVQTPTQEISDGVRLGLRVLGKRYPVYAAAPDLLAACKEASDAIDELLHHAEYMPGIFQASERARQACLAAIARAKGADNGN